MNNISSARCVPSRGSAYSLDSRPAKHATSCRLLTYDLSRTISMYMVTQSLCLRQTRCTCGIHRCALALVCSATLAEKVDFMHSLFDFRSDGDLTLPEVTILVRTALIACAKVSVAGGVVDRIVWHSHDAIFSRTPRFSSSSTGISAFRVHDNSCRRALGCGKLFCLLL